jgi:O-antigen/teichoic acid export membrane protein
MFKRLKDLLSDSAIYGSSDILQKVVGFLLLPLYTRYLTTSDYGILAMLLVVTVLFKPAANLGMSNAIFREYARNASTEAKQKIVSTGFFSNLIMASILFLLGQLGAELINEVLIGDPETVLLVRLTLLSAFLLSVNLIAYVILKVEKRLKTLAVFNLLKLVVSVGVIAYFVVFMELVVLGFVLGNLIVDVVFVVALLVSVLKPLINSGSLPHWKKMVSYGLPFSPSNSAPWV